MQQACKLMVAFLAGKTPSDYESDPLLRSGVERQLMIVGEALSRLKKVEPSLITLITDSRQIIAFRNILVHGYDIIRNEVVWGILESDLPTLSKRFRHCSNREETSRQVPNRPSKLQNLTSEIVS
jgi:uncharacterized protein with HEPN domain